MNKSYWNADSVISRIRDIAGKKRFAAGSPDAFETLIYSRFLPSDCQLVVVLGMTPELRNMAAGFCRRLISIDHNEVSISTYKDWLSPAFSSRERIVQGDWNDLEKILPESADFVLGDGIFGNIVPLSNYSGLLKLIRSVLTHRGCFVTRQCLMPDWVLEKPDQRHTLLEKYRNRTLNEAAFGLSMRLHGYSDIAYDPDTALLDNKKVFSAVDEDLQSGFLLMSEYRIIRRYFFDGMNSLPTQRAWETILKATGFAFTRPVYTGEYWYAYYPVYCCHLN